MAKTKYNIHLNEYERDYLLSIIDGKAESARTLLRAQILLYSDVSMQPKYSVIKLAEKLGTTHTTIQTTRTEYAEGGIEKALYRKEHVFVNNKYNEDITRKINALLDEKPPEGRDKWSIRSLCEAAVQRGIVVSIVPSSMFRILKK